MCRASSRAETRCCAVVLGPAAVEHQRQEVRHRWRERSDELSAIPGEQELPFRLAALGLAEDAVSTSARLCARDNRLPISRTTTEVARHFSWVRPFNAAALAGRRRAPQ